MVKSVVSSPSKYVLVSSPLSIGKVGAFEKLGCIRVHADVYVRVHVHPHVRAHKCGSVVVPCWQRLEIKILYHSPLTL